MGKIRQAIVDAGSLKAAWHGDLQRIGLGSEVLSAIEEILAADHALFSARGKAGERKSIDPEIANEIRRLTALGGITSGKVVERLKATFGKKAPSRATVHRYMVEFQRGGGGKK